MSIELKLILTEKLTLIARASDMWDKCGQSKTNEDFSGKIPSSSILIPNSSLFVWNSFLVGLNGKQTWQQKGERWDILLTAQ